MLVLLCHHYLHVMSMWQKNKHLNFALTQSHGYETLEFIGTKFRKKNLLRYLLLISNFNTDVRLELSVSRPSGDAKWYTSKQKTVYLGYQSSFPVSLGFYVVTAWHLFKLWCYDWCLPKVAHAKHEHGKRDSIFDLKLMTGFVFEVFIVWGKNLKSHKNFKLWRLICLIKVRCQLCLLLHKVQSWKTHQSLKSRELFYEMLVATLYIIWKKHWKKGASKVSDIWHWSSFF